MLPNQKTIGKISMFGGPADTGVRLSEGLALIEARDLFVGQNDWLWVPKWDMLAGLARNLNPEAFYCAMRWDYTKLHRTDVRNGVVRIKAANGRIAWARPVDWGPNIDTGRIIDVSPGVMRALGIKTDAIVECELFL